MAAELYKLVFGRDKTQSEIEELVDAVLTEKRMTIDGERERKTEAHGWFSSTKIAHSQVKYNSWALGLLVKLLIPEHPQNDAGYTVPVTFTYYGSDMGRSESETREYYKKHGIYSPEEIITALRESARKTRELPF